MDKVLYAGNAIIGAFVQELLSMPINLLLTSYLVYPRYLFKMGPAYMFSRGVETLRIDGYLTLILPTHGELTKFHRLMKYGEPLSRDLFLHVCCWTEDAAGGISLDAKQAFFRRRENRKDGRRSEGCEWRNTSPDRLLFGHEI